jgi:hypothetical protein
VLIKGDFLCPPMKLRTDYGPEYLEQIKGGGKWSEIGMLKISYGEDSQSAAFIS